MNMSYKLLHVVHTNIDYSWSVCLIIKKTNECINQFFGSSHFLIIKLNRRIIDH